VTTRNPPLPTDFRIAVVAACNDQNVLRTNLARSEMIHAGVPLIEEWGHKSASAAHNAGLAKTDADVTVHAHQDVYLPRGWETRLRREIARVESRDPNWAVLGLIGSTQAGEIAGKVYSAGLSMEVGRDVSDPTPAISVDEMVIILRPASGIRFDEGLPGFHLYGVDIVQTALAAGKSAYIIQAPAVHNSNPVKQLDAGYVRAYRFVQRKWRDRLPIPNVVAWVTPWGWPMHRQRIWSFVRYKIQRRPATGSRKPDGAEVARQIRYDTEATA
jgi:hypothetical protein